LYNFLTAGLTGNWRQFTGNRTRWRRMLAIDNTFWIWMRDTGVVLIRLWPSILNRRWSISAGPMPIKGRIDFDGFEVPSAEWHAKKLRVQWWGHLRLLRALKDYENLEKKPYRAATWRKMARPLSSLEFDESTLWLSFSVGGRSLSPSNDLAWAHSIEMLGLRKGLKWLSAPTLEESHLSSKMPLDPKMTLALYPKNFMIMWPYELERL